MKVCSAWDHLSAPKLCYRPLYYTKAHFFFQDTFYSRQTMDNTPLMRSHLIFRFCSLFKVSLYTSFNKYNTHCALKVEKSEGLINSIVFIATVLHHFNYITLTSTYTAQKKEEKKNQRYERTKLFPQSAVRKPTSQSTLGQIYCTDVWEQMGTEYVQWLCWDPARRIWSALGAQRSEKIHGEGTLPTDLSY